MDILAELQHFVITETVRTTIAPGTVFSRPCGRIAQRLLPFKTILQRNTFYHTATGPAYKGGVKSFQHFSHIFPQSIRTVVESFFGKEGNVIHIDCTRSIKFQSKLSFGRSRRRLHCQAQVVPLSGSSYINRSGSQHFALLGQQQSSHFSLVIGSRADNGTQLIRVVFHQIHPPVSFVYQANRS